MNHVCTASLALLLAASAACAGVNDVWNVTADFSNAQGNPNGSWSYGWYSPDFTGFNLMTPFVGNDGSPGWTGNIGGDRTPAVYHNTGGGALQHNVPLNWMTLHPGPGGQGATARWTCPQGVSGAVSIYGEFLTGDGGVMQVAVRVKNIEVFHAADGGAFTLCEQVEPGDTIEFVAYGGYAYGSTPLRAVISTGRCPADLGSTGGAATACGDSQLDNNDFVVFIEHFFAHDARADFGQTGGLPGADGEYDNNDFVVFIDAFFTGC